jgi:nitrogenase iron protein NifH
LGGIIYNGRSVVDEPSIIDGFAARLGTQVVGRMPMNDLIPRSEIHHKTVIEYAPDSEIAEIFKRIGRNILENRKTTVPKPLSDEELNEINREVEDLFREKTLTQLST